MLLIPPAPIKVWKTVPNYGDFNSGTRHGQAIFNENSKRLPEDKHLDLPRLDGRDIHKVLHTREFHLHGIVNVFSTKVHLFRVVHKKSNLLSQHREIILEDCQSASLVMFYNRCAHKDAVTDSLFNLIILDPARNPRHKSKFNKIANSNVAVKMIENFLPVNRFDDILEHKEQLLYLLNITFVS